MKKITALALAAVLAAGTIFAQPAQKKDREGSVPDRNPVKKEMAFPGFPAGKMRMPDFESCSENEAVIIGIVRKVNSSEGTIVVVNTDGKDETVKITPFSRVKIKGDSFARRQNKNDGDKLSQNKTDKVSEIHSGAWVMIKTYKTETKSKIASSVFVKNNPPPVDLSDAK